MEWRSVAKSVAALGDRVRPAPTGITVLIYHRVGGGSGGEVDLDVDGFRAQLAHLAEHHRVLSLDHAADELDREPGSGATGEPGVVITFDDGTDDFCDHAVPALVEAGLPATLYVATRFVDESVEFPWGAPPASWAGLAEATATGLVTIGSHTHGHALLDRADAVADELDRSIELIGEHLGSTPQHFAYPKALPPHADAEAEVRSRFRTAALARSRVNVPGDTDLHRLWRTPIQRSDGQRFFESKAAGGLRLEGELRDLAARLRYRGASA